METTKFIVSVTVTTCGGFRVCTIVYRHCITTIMILYNHWNMTFYNDRIFVRSFVKGKNIRLLMFNIRFTAKTWKYLSSMLKHLVSEQGVNNTWSDGYWEKNIVGSEIWQVELVLMLTRGYYLRFLVECWLSKERLQTNSPCWLHNYLLFNNSLRSGWGKVISSMGNLIVWPVWTRLFSK